MAGLFGGIFGGHASAGIAHGGGAAPAPVFGGVPAAPAAAPGVAGAPVQQEQAQPEGSSLDKLTSFWDTLKDSDGKPVAPAADPTTQSIYNFDPAKVNESARSLDFTQGLDPELVTKALGGDVQAFLQTINHATQTAFAAATINTGKLINDGHATNNERVKSILPTQIKKVQLSQTATTNPILQHAAAQPLVEALKSMAFAKNPNANPADVTASVEALLIGLGTAAAENTPDALQKKQVAAAGEQDWSSFF